MDIKFETIHIIKITGHEPLSSTVEDMDEILGILSKLTFCYKFCNESDMWKSFSNHYDDFFEKKVEAILDKYFLTIEMFENLLEDEIPTNPDMITATKEIELLHIISSMGNSLSSLKSFSNKIIIFSYSELERELITEILNKEDNTTVVFIRRYSENINIDEEDNLEKIPDELINIEIVFFKIVNDKVKKFDVKLCFDIFSNDEKLVVKRNNTVDIFNSMLDDLKYQDHIKKINKRIKLWPFIAAFASLASIYGFCYYRFF